jgi:AcrR family transcriptional regulator
VSPKTSTRLSKDVVVDRALVVADAEGLDAVTIRRLATDLDVTPMALYWHFKTKDDLLDGIADRILDHVVVPSGRSSWHARIEQSIRALVTAMRPHPAVAILVAKRVLQHPNGLAITEAALTALEEAGFSAGDAAQIAVNAMNTAIQLVSSPQVQSGDGPGDAAELRTKAAAIKALDPVDYPHVIAFADELLCCDEDEAFFELGVDLFVAGVQGLARKRREPRER